MDTKDKEDYILEQLRKVNQDDLREFAEFSETKRILRSLDNINPRLAELKPSLKIIALYLQMTKNINLTDVIHDTLYRFKVLTIEEFLSPDILGKEKAGYYAPETSWGKVIRDFFRPKSTFFEIIAAGAIGTGKSVACQTMAIYNLYRVCCLRHPQAFMGSDVTKYLTWQIITPSLKTSQRLALEPIVECLRLYSAFEEVRTEKDLNFYVGNKIAWRKTPDGVDFENRIRITGGSRVQHALGQEVFSVLSDEADFSLSADKTQSFFLYSKLLKRITSRFKNGLYNAKYLFAAIISSTTHEKGVINTYAKEIQNSKRNVSTKVISFRQWDIKGGLNPFGIDGKQYFYCLRGNLMNPSKVFDDREKELIESGVYKTPGGCSLIKVPLRYYDDFINHLETALQDLAGEATLLNECPIQTLDGCIDNMLCPLITVNASINAKTSIINQIPNTYFDSRERWKRYPDIQRYSHVDLAISGRASLCVLHKELSETNRQFIVVDFILDIIASDKIDVNKVADFFEDLKEHNVFNFSTVTYDQFNSAFLESRLIKNQIAPNIKHLSVESSAIYGMTASLIAEKRLRVGEPGLLEKQLTSIQIINNKPFIDPNITGHKDCADALVGAVYNAVINLNDQPSNIYETYNKYLAGIFEIDKTKYRKLDL